MNCALPKRVSVGGRDWDIRSDYRAVLDICAALSDPELPGTGKALCALKIFYPDFWALPPELYEDALQACFRFLNGGYEPGPERKRAPKLVDWEQDFPYIIAAVNRAAGRELREEPYLHWWTFLGLYNEIGECTFAGIVRIRNKLARRQRLDRDEAAFYREHRDAVEFRNRFTADEAAFLKRLAGKSGN